ncbi:discoidin, CUB and LCCL domain-containing protein 1-like isoform X3 [Anolis sagrei]|uniref:discoidin, CUB and LCCL domain-containing protein 1-like isoform X3 n=1 Tax=Anolis sagrei TaxID=38937 RepID=UPI003522CA07
MAVRKGFGHPPFGRQRPVPAAVAQRVSFGRRDRTPPPTSGPRRRRRSKPLGSPSVCLPLPPFLPSFLPSSPAMLPEPVPGLFVLLLLSLGASPSAGQEGDGCGHSVLTPSSGTLTSKNYPNTYPNFTSCEWKIHGAGGRRLSLAFGDVDIEASEQCRSGFLLLSSPLDGSSFDLISCLQKGIHYDKKIIRAYCPAGCKGITGDIWGNMDQGYRDTSVLCKAAIHAGVISDEQGGEVTILREKGITLYESAFSNGICSKRGSLSEKRIVFHKACAGRLEIASFHASSYWKEENAMGEDRSWTPNRAALDVDGSSWAANENSENEWLEIDLGGRKNITGIVTKGSSHPHNYYVESYKVLSSRDGKNWKVYKAKGGNEDKVFEGNHDSHQEASNTFIPPIVARYLRIAPQSWNQKVALKMMLWGCQVARPKALHPYSDSGTHRGPKELPVLTSSPDIFTQIPGTVISSEKTGPPLLVMLLIGGFVLICSALLLLVFLCRKKRKAVVDQDCDVIKDASVMNPIPEPSQLWPGRTLQLSSSEVTSFHGAGMPVDVGRAQSPEYAEPDVVQVSPSSQTAPSTFKPALDESYTLPLFVNHYDVPSKYHEYAEPLPPEPEYATPFLEQATQPGRDTCRTNTLAVKAIPSSKSLTPLHPEVQMQHAFHVPMATEKLETISYES